MSVHSSDDPHDRSIQIDPDTCRSILADEIPGDWTWREGAFHLDGPGDLSARVRIELDDESDAWTIEPSVCGEPLDAYEAPRLGLHGELEAVAERLRGAVIAALDEMHLEANRFRRELLVWNGREVADARHGDPFSRGEIINRLALCNPNADERMDIVDVACSIETGGYPSGAAGLVLAVDLLDSPEALDDATAERIGGRLRAFAGELEETGRQLEARGRELAG